MSCKWIMLADMPCCMRDALIYFDYIIFGKQKSQLFPENQPKNKTSSIKVELPCIVPNMG